MDHPNIVTGKIATSQECILMQPFNSLITHRTAIITIIIVIKIHYIQYENIRKLSNDIHLNGEDEISMADRERANRTMIIVGLTDYNR